MTNDDPLADATASLMIGIDRMLAESRAIDIRESLKGISADKSRNNKRGIRIRRNRRTL